ncbi:hypothetical protein [Sphingomonas sp.]|uniref:hypothetical protein n=1 Tax=Sphingomonas sp. TaxID=28214 RepID=UPI0025FDAD23|nr:hypothetical protein [Sphingomonas sp.]
MRHVINSKCCLHGDSFDVEIGGKRHGRFLVIQVAIRAGIPASWRGFDKTGTGMRPGIGNKTNDLAVLVPPGGRSPLVVIGYFENPSFSEETRPEDEAVLKVLGEVAVA